MKTAAAVLLVVMGVLAGCATTAQQPAPQQDVLCLQEPQWRTKNQTGQEVGVFVCFGRDNQLLYQTRLLPPPPPPAQAAAPAPAPEPAKTVKPVLTPEPPSPELLAERKRRKAFEEKVAALQAEVEAARAQLAAQEVETEAQRAARMAAERAKQAEAISRARKAESEATRP